MAETGLTPAQKQVIAKKKTLSEMFSKTDSRLRDALENTGITPKQMIGVAMTAINKTPKLLDCTPQSVIQAVMLAAEAGLPVDGYHAHLIPYGAQCQFIVDFKGLIQLALANDVVIDAAAVYEKDEFSYRLGLDPYIDHVPFDDDDRGPLRCAYAIARFGNNYRKFVVATKREIEKRRAASKSGSGKDSPWKLWEAEMWTKTAVKMLAKFIPRSPRLSSALSSDDLADQGTQYTEHRESKSSVISDVLEASSSTDTISAPATEAPEKPPEPPFSLESFEHHLKNCETVDAVTAFFNSQVKSREEEVSVDVYEKAYDLCKERAAAIRSAH